MEEQLINFETAKLVKEKGFNEFCRYIYPFKTFLNYEEDCGKEFKKAISYSYTFLDETVPIIYAPTQALLQKWLREEHNFWINVYTINCDPSCFKKGSERTHILGYRVAILHQGKFKEQLMVDGFGDTYKEILEKALHKALTTIGKELKIGN